MSRRAVLALLAVLVLVAGAYLAYDQFLRGDEVPPLTLPSSSPDAADGSGSPGASPAPGATAGAAQPADLAGDWTVADGSVVGYRVREKLASLPAQSDAVGRTSAVSGTAALATSGDSVRLTAAHFEADLTTLQSDDGRRDRRIAQIGLESSTFPTGAFTLTSPIDVPVTALAGATVDVTLAGDLTIHGVTKAVSIPAQARVAGGRIEVQGSLTFPFADFGMTPPDIAGFVTVEPDATLEFLVVLAPV